MRCLFLRQTLHLWHRVPLIWKWTSTFVWRILAHGTIALLSAWIKKLPSWSRPTEMINSKEQKKKRKKGQQVQLPNPVFFSQLTLLNDIWNMMVGFKEGFYALNGHFVNSLFVAIKSSIVDSNLTKVINAAILRRRI